MKAHRLLEQIGSIESWSEAADLLQAAGKFEMGLFSHFASEALWSFTQSVAEKEILRTPFPSTYFEFSANRPEASFDCLGCLAWVRDSSLFVRGYVLIEEKWGRFPGTGILTRDGFAFHSEVGSETGEHLIKATIAVAGAIAAIASHSSTVEKVLAPAALNKKRLQRGHIPLSDYHVVTIRQRAPHPMTQSPGERDMRRASPTVHWRRGHFRALASGREVPVAPALVGATDSGFVASQYRFILGSKEE